MIEIKRYDNGEIIHSGDFESIKECLEDGVSKNISFYRAYLVGANLERANLLAANLERANGILIFKSNDSGRIFYAVNHESKIMLKAGCFWGTAQELKSKIVEENKTETHWDYLMAIEWASMAFGIEEEE